MELLVACVVFAIMVTLVLQSFGAISGTAKFSQRRLETLKQVMSALERVRFDIGQGARTGGLSPYVIKDTDDAGNDALFFVGPVDAASAPEDARRLSIVRYGVQSRSAGTPDFTGWPDLPGFAQTIHPFGWNEDLGRILPWSTASADEALSRETPQLIAPGVFRFEVSFELWDGRVSSRAPDDWKTVRALVLSVAVFDKKAAFVLTPQQRQDLAAMFPNVNDGLRPADVWRLPTSRMQSLPLPVRETLHVYEKIVAL